MSDNPDKFETFTTSDLQLVYEHGVGLEIEAYKPDVWLSWEETQALTRWLAGNVWKLPPA
jgi:hypothetical protein